MLSASLRALASLCKLKPSSIPSKLNILSAIKERAGEKVPMQTAFQAR
jgi:hypothetical protein